MPYSSTTICGYLLKAAFRTGHTADFPSTYYVALFAGDPEAGGLEPDSTGGYARLAVANTDAEFTITGDQVTNANNWAWPTSTAAYQAGRQILTHWALMSATTAGTRILSGRVLKSGIPSSINVDGANLVPKISASSWAWRQKP